MRTTDRETPGRRRYRGKAWGAAPAGDAGRSGIQLGVLPGAGGLRLVRRRSSPAAEHGLSRLSHTLRLVTDGPRDPVTACSYSELCVDCLPCRIFAECARGLGMIVEDAGVTTLCGGLFWMRRAPVWRLCLGAPSTGRAQRALPGELLSPMLGRSPTAGATGSRRRSRRKPPSSSGLGHRPFKAAARVRIPLGALLA